MHLNAIGPHLSLRGGMGEREVIGLNVNTPPCQSHKLTNEVDILVLAEVESAGIDYNRTLENS